jgi:hypothetical protein
VEAGIAPDDKEMEAKARLKQQRTGMDECWPWEGHPGQQLRSALGDVGRQGHPHRSYDEELDATLVAKALHC